MDIVPLVCEYTLLDTYMYRHMHLPLVTQFCDNLLRLPHTSTLGDIYTLLNVEKIAYLMKIEGKYLSVLHKKGIAGTDQLFSWKSGPLFVFHIKLSVSLFKVIVI